MKKRIVSIILLVITLLSLTSWSVFAEEETEPSDDAETSEVYLLEGTETSDATLRRIQSVNTTTSPTESSLTVYDVWFSGVDDSYFSAEKIEYRSFVGTEYGFVSVLFDATTGISITSAQIVERNLERVEHCEIGSCVFEDDVLRAGLKRIKVELSTPAYVTTSRYELYTMYTVTYVVETADGISEREYSITSRLSYQTDDTYWRVDPDHYCHVMLQRTLIEKICFSLKIEFFEELLVSGGSVYAQFVHKGSLYAPSEDTDTNTSVGGGVVSGGSDDGLFDFEFLKNRPVLKTMIWIISTLCFFYEIYWVISKIKESRKKKRKEK